jgi:hypothetical protein
MYVWCGISRHDTDSPLNVRTGKIARFYVEPPAGGHAPGLVLIQEWSGL